MKEIVKTEAIERLRGAASNVLGRATDRLLASLLAPLLPDMSAVVNWSAILGGLVSFVAAAFPTPLRRAFVIGGVAGVAIGVAREASRKKFVAA